MLCYGKWHCQQATMPQHEPWMDPSFCSTALVALTLYGFPSHCSHQNGCSFTPGHTSAVCPSPLPQRTPCPCRWSPRPSSDHPPCETCCPNLPHPPPVRGDLSAFCVALLTCIPDCSRCKLQPACRPALGIRQPWGGVGSLHCPPPNFSPAVKSILQGSLRPEQENVHEGTLAMF